MFTKEMGVEIGAKHSLMKSIRIQNEANTIATGEATRIAGECLRLEFSETFERYLPVWRKRFASLGLKDPESEARRAASVDAWSSADKAFHLAFTENHPRLWALWYERLLAEEDKPDTDDRPEDPKSIER